jgi:hypothetical protein
MMKPESSRHAGYTANYCGGCYIMWWLLRPKDHSDIEVSIPDAAARCSQVVATPEGAFPSHSTIQTSHM